MRMGKKTGCHDWFMCCWVMGNLGGNPRPDGSHLCFKGVQSVSAEDRSDASLLQPMFISGRGFADVTAEVTFSYNTCIPFVNSGGRFGCASYSVCLRTVGSDGF